MNVAQARKDIRYLASLVKGLVALDEELERVGSLDKLIEAQQARLATLEREERDIIAMRAEAAALTAEIAEKQVKLDGIKADYQRLSSDAA